MKQVINEAKRIQQLAGLLNEVKSNELKIGNHYQVLDSGMDQWHDDFKYLGTIGGGSSVGDVGEHMFAAAEGVGSFTFVSIPDADLDAIVKPSEEA